MHQRRTKGQQEEQLLMETRSLYKEKQIEIKVRKGKASEDLKVQGRIFAACRKGKEPSDTYNI